MWILQLNDMRSSKIEQLTTICRSENKEDLTILISRELVEPYRDGNWYKVFRQGGFLEWFNPPDIYSGIVKIDTLEEWLINAKNQYNSIIQEIPHCESFK